MDTRSDLPTEITRTVLFGDDIRYRLPRRDLGRARLFGLIFILFGAVFATAPTIGMWSGFIRSVLKNQVDWFSLIFALFSLPFLLAGLGIVGIGSFILWGRTEVIVRGETLVTRERGGLFRWTRKIPIEIIMKLQIAGGRSSDGLASMAALVADVGEKQPRWIAAGYTTELLEPLAENLARYLREYRVLESIQVEQVEPQPTESKASGVDSESVTQLAEPVLQPTGSRAVLERFEGGGITLNVPAAGIIRGSKGLFFFSIFWTLFTGGICCVFFFASGKAGDWKMLLLVVPFSLVFVGVGVGMMVAAINMGTRRVAVAVFDGSLMLMRKGVFGTKKAEWTAEEIESVGVGPSGMEVNDVPVLEFQVVVRGSKHGMLAGHPTDELEWIADEVRRALDRTSEMGG